MPRIKIWPAYYLFITGKGRKAEPVLVAKNPLPSGGNAVAIGHEDLSMEGVVRRKFKAKEELTPEERELLRKLRKERRQRAKENKRQEKEEAKRLQITGAKDLKISLISREVLQKFYGKWSETSFSRCGSKFFSAGSGNDPIFFSHCKCAIADPYNFMRIRIQNLKKICNGSGSRPNFDTYPDPGKNGSSIGSRTKLI